MADGTLTDDIWWAAQDPRLQKIRYLSVYDPLRKLTIQTLFNEGVLMDGPVVGMGYSPAWQMTYLKENGYAWFPALGYPQLAGAPSIVPQGPQPPWGIKVSTDANDYPKWKEA